MIDPRWFEQDSPTVLLSTADRMNGEDDADWAMHRYFEPPLKIDLKEATKLYLLSRIVKQFGPWAVTEYGLECLVAYYPIGKDRLYEGGQTGWIKHMKGRRQPTSPMYLPEFTACLYAAREYHSKPKPKPIKSTTPIQATRRVAAPKPPKAVKLPKPKRVKMDITLRDRFLIFKRDGYRCQKCGRDASDGVKLEVGHIVAKKHGGTAEYSNLLCLCFDCNRGQQTDEL